MESSLLLGRQAKAAERFDQIVNGIVGNGEHGKHHDIFRVPLRIELLNRRQGQLEAQERLHYFGVCFTHYTDSVLRPES